MSLYDLYYGFPPSARNAIQTLGELAGEPRRKRGLTRGDPEPRQQKGGPGLLEAGLQNEPSGPTPGRTRPGRNLGTCSA
jgi:hypothetical protein